MKDMGSFIILETMEQNSTFRAKALVEGLIVSLSALAVVATLPSCDSNFIVIVCTITYIFRVLYCHEFISSLRDTLKLSVRRRKQRFPVLYEPDHLAYKVVLS